MADSLRIIFMGTPDFAVPSLDILLRNGFEVVAVVTAADKPAGRGLQPRACPVKTYAVSRGLPVLQPLRLRDPEFLMRLRELRADIQVVVAFRMLPEQVWAMPPLGTINLHASLLPQYRGAAPINWVLMNGEKETGVTTFRLQHEIDTGEILDQRKIPIYPEETAGELHDRLMTAGADLVLDTLKSIASGNYQLTPQPEVPAGSLHTAPRIYREDCRIDWNRDAQDICNLIRGLSPYPAAWTLLDGKTLKIYQAKATPAEVLPAPGTADTSGESLRIACRDGWITPVLLQLEGKKKMTAEAFLRGYRDRPWKIG
jgi:methionyl-tRNA formyltransferase